MKRYARPVIASRRADGFTLIETVIALCVASLIGLMMVTLTHSPLLSAVDATARSQTQFELQREMEEIIAEYRRLLRVSQATSTPFTKDDFVTAVTTLTCGAEPKFKYQDGSKTGYLAVGQVAVTGPGAAFSISADLNYRVTLTRSGQSYSSVFTFPN